MSFKVAVVQFRVNHWETELNLQRIENFVKQAVDLGAEVVVFPEDCVTGPMLRNMKFVDDDCKLVGIFSEMAKKYRVDLVPGSFMEKEDGVVFNTTYYIDFNGKVLGKYKKVNLWVSERGYIAPGTEVVYFQTRFGRAGLVICWDLTDGNMFKEFKQAGVEIVYCPSDWAMNLVEETEKFDDPEIRVIGEGAWKSLEARHVNGLCQARSLENNLVVVYAGLAEEIQYKDGGKDVLIGQSQVVLPMGVESRIQSNLEQILIAEIDLATLKQSAESYKLID